MAKQTFTTGQVLTAAQMTSLQQTAMLGGDASAKVASYVLVAADAGTAISMSNGSATTITVNTGLFAAGDIVTIINLGAGVCTITAGTATVTTSGSLALAQNQGGVLRFTSASAAIFFQFATPASGDIEGVTAGTGISGGGTSGTVTITNSMATEITAKGDLIVGTGNATFDNLPVGTNGYTLVADSAETTGLKWAAPAGGGKVLQVVSATTTTATTIASTTLTDTTITASITPSAATSKVLILISASAITSRASDFALGSFSVLRGATEIMDNKNNDDAFGVQAYQSGATQSNWYGQLGITYLDSPNTTSSTTYKLQASAERTANSGQVIFQSNGNMSTITLLEIGA